jgi:hypothetical protein
MCPSMWVEWHDGYAMTEIDPFRIDDDLHNVKSTCRERKTGATVWRGMWVYCRIDEFGAVKYEPR